MKDQVKNGQVKNGQVKTAKSTPHQFCYRRGMVTLANNGNPSLGGIVTDRWGWGPGQFFEKARILLVVLELSTIESIHWSRLVAQGHYWASFQGFQTIAPVIAIKPTRTQDGETDRRNGQRNGNESGGWLYHPSEY